MKRLTAKCFCCNANVTQTSAQFIAAPGESAKGPFGPIKGQRVYGPKCWDKAIAAGTFNMTPGHDWTIK